MSRSRGKGKDKDKGKRVATAWTLVVPVAVAVGLRVLPVVALPGGGWQTTRPSTPATPWARSAPTKCDVLLLPVLLLMLPFAVACATALLLAMFWAEILLLRCLCGTIIL